MTKGHWSLNSTFTGTNGQNWCERHYRIVQLLLFSQAMTMIDRRSSFQDEPLVNRHDSTAQSSCCCVFFPHHCDLHVQIIHPSWRSNNQDGRTHGFLFVYSFVCLFLCWIILFFCNLLADLTAIRGIYKCISAHRIKYWLYVFTRKSFENWFM